MRLLCLISCAVRHPRLHLPALKHATSLPQEFNCSVNKSLFCATLFAHAHKCIKSLSLAVKDKKAISAQQITDLISADKKKLVVNWKLCLICIISVKMADVMKTRNRGVIVSNHIIIIISFVYPCSYIKLFCDCSPDVVTRLCFSFLSSPDIRAPV